MAFKSARQRRGFFARFAKKPVYAFTYQGDKEFQGKKPSAVITGTNPDVAPLGKDFKDADHGGNTFRLVSVKKTGKFSRL
jgi:hypothetical protein